MAKLDRNTIIKLPAPTEGKFDIVHWDDDLPGLGLRILKSGSRSWVVRYRVGRRQRVINLGRIALLTPGQARTKASEILAKAKLGEDVSSALRAKRAEPVGSTLGDLIKLFVSRYVDRHQKASTAAETKRLLATKWKPLHQMPIGEVSRPLVAERLTKLEIETSAITRNRSRAALSRLFTWAMEEGLAEQNPVIGTAKRTETARERILRSEELQAIWAATSGPGDHNTIIRLLMLTGQRREEVASATWQEINFDKAVWSLPAKRTKNGRPHEVPLAHQALEILEQIPRRIDRAFIFGEGNGPFSGWSQSKERLDRRSGVENWRLHDLRRTLVTGMAEIGIQPHVIEAVVNHISGHKAGVAGVYNLATYANEKRIALQQWADHLNALVG